MANPPPGSCQFYQESYFAKTVDSVRFRTNPAARTQKEKSRPRKRVGVTLPVFAPRGALGHKRVLSDGLLLARLKTVRPLYRDSPSGGTRPADVVEAGDDVATIRLFRRLVRERKVSLSNVPARVRLHLSRS
jgi:hypothetical protein